MIEGDDVRFTQIHAGIAETDHAHERTEEAAICGEIARHLLDLRETTSASRAAQFVAKLYAIFQVEPEALWLVLRIMSGDLSEVTRSFSELGKERGMSKQGQQQLQERVLRALHMHYPQAEKALVQLFGTQSGYLKKQQ